MPQFVRDETGKFVVAGNGVAAEATAFYALVVQSDNDFYATVVATSPSCPVPDLLADVTSSQYPPTKLYGLRGIADLYASANLDIAKEAKCADYRARLSALRDTTLKQPEPWVDLESRYREQHAPLCMPASEISCLGQLQPAQQRSAYVEVRPSPLGTENFKVELDTLKGISEYLEALGKLAANPNSRVDDNLTKAVEKLEQVQGYVDAKWVTDEIKEKQKAVGGLLATLKELRDSSKQATKIRQMLMEKSESIAASLEDLADRSDRTYREVYLQSVSLRATRLKNYLEMQSAGQTLADRQIAMTQYHKDALILRGAMLLKTDETAQAADASPTGIALRGVIAAQEKLIEAINNPDDKQRAEIAANSLRNFRNVLKGLYGVLGAFGVL
jgi:hypothetical protein